MPGDLLIFQATILVFYQGSICRPASCPARDRWPAAVDDVRTVFSVAPPAQRSWNINSCSTWRWEERRPVVAGGDRPAAGCAGVSDSRRSYLAGYRQAPRRSRERLFDAARNVDQLAGGLESVACRDSGSLPGMAGFPPQAVRRR